MEQQSNLDDELGSLVGRVRQRKQSGGEKTRAQPKASGFIPSDLLFLPDDQKKMVNLLSRLGRARIKEICDALAISREETLKTLNDLKDVGYVKESLLNGDVYYHVKFADTATRSRTGLPKEFLESARVDDAAFLRSINLFKDTSDAEIDFIVKNVKAERYERNDVIFWQGESSKSFYIVKNGVVAVSNLSSNGASNLLAYLEQGNFFGEGGLLTGMPATATVTAFTPVEAMSLSKEHFNSMLSRNSDISMKLASVLAQRLSSTNARLASQRGETKLSLVIGAGEKCGATTIAVALALASASTSKERPAYIELPQQSLSSVFNFSPDLQSYSHPGGFEALNPATAADIPQSAQAALIVDQAANRFSNIFVSIPAEFVEQMEYLIVHASQIVMVAPPLQENWKRVASLLPVIKSKINASKTRIFTVINRFSADIAELTMDVQADFDIPFFDSLPQPADQQLDNLPEPLKKMASSMLDMLGYTSQVGIYIPTTIGVDQQADTSAYVEKTLAFMGKLFGGATHEQVRGVWNSNDAGIVAESIHVVKSFCSPSALDQNMGAIVDYMETLKQDLQQEAMALEVNQKLMLI